MLWLSGTARRELTYPCTTSFERRQAARSRLLAAKKLWREAVSRRASASDAPHRGRPAWELLRKGAVARVAFARQLGTARRRMRQFIRGFHLPECVTVALVGFGYRSRQNFQLQQAAFLLFFQIFAPLFHVNVVPG